MPRLELGTSILEIGMIANFTTPVYFCTPVWNRTRPHGLKVRCLLPVCYEGGYCPRCFEGGYCFRLMYVFRFISISFCGISSSFLLGVFCCLNYILRAGHICDIILISFLTTTYKEFYSFLSLLCF